MPRTRQDVWKLGKQPWNDTLLWYARAVGELKKRKIADRTSWRYLGAMHGFDPNLWSAFGFTGHAGDPLPSQSDQDKFWQQCQHQSWFFLPWHRGYLAAFEAIIRDAIAKLHGPADTWALPYWNYSDASDANALKLPPAFSEKNLPNGDPNPLFEPRRYGDGTGHVVIHQIDVGLNALKLPHFPGTATGGSTGFGGPRTHFRHDGPGSANGGVENRPHNVVHGLVGGAKAGTNPNDPRNLGLMSMPDTAALDAVFWLHHANIDRLWEVWIKRPGGHKDPPDTEWNNGPNDRKFVMPQPDGTGKNFTAHAMLDTQAPGLDYVYEDVSDPFGGVNPLVARLQRLGVQPEAVERIRPEAAMAEEQPAELVGANDAAIRLEGNPVETRVRLDRAATQKVARSFRAEAITGAQAKEPDRVFLNLENIRGHNDSAVFYVYVNLPEGGDPAKYPDHLAGVVSLFGVHKATRSDDTHGGNGINESLDITDIVDKLHLENALDADHLKVRIVPRTRMTPQDDISVGRISVYRQGG